MKTLKVDHIVATVGVGRIDDAVREAIILSLTENRIVKFEFNAKPIEVEPADVIDHIMKQYAKV